MADDKPNKSHKAIRVRTETSESKQLQVFVRNLGATETAELYMVGNLAYMKINLLLQLLSVSEKWFINNSVEYTFDSLEIPHYIKLKKGIYVNKYGITKLISQSKEAVAFKLQDYIYEVIYKLEKNGTVSMDDIESRKELERTLVQFQEVQDRNLEELKEYDINVKTLELELYEATLKAERLRVECKYKEELIQEYEDDTNKLINACSILGKYVKKKKPAATLIDDLNVDDIVDFDSDDDVTHQDALDALATFKKTKKDIKHIRERPQVSETKNAERPKEVSIISDASTKSIKKYPISYLIRSNEPFYQDAYMWAIKSEIPTKCSINTLSYDNEELLYESYKEYSKGVISGECKPNHGYRFVHYADLRIDVHSKKIVSMMLSASVFRIEDIDIIISQNGW